MKSLILFVLALTMVLPGVAYDKFDLNYAEIIMDHSDEEISFDVIGTRGDFVDIVIFRDKGEDLSAEVVSQSAGFECEILLAKNVRVGNSNQRAFHVVVDWAPGADLSGCQVTIDSNKDQFWNIELFMNY